MYAWLTIHTGPKMALVLSVLWYAALIALIALLAAGIPQAEFRYGEI